MSLIIKRFIQNARAYTSKGAFLILLSIWLLQIIKKNIFRCKTFFLGYLRVINKGPLSLVEIIQAKCDTEDQHHINYLGNPRAE